MKKILLLAMAMMCTFALCAKTVSVVVTPTTATIYQKGKAIVPVSPGVYNLPVNILAKTVYTIQAEGYDSEQFVVDRKSPSQIQIDLKPNKKEVNISTDPDNARIYVDGKESGQGHVTFPIRKGETIQIKAVADGYDNYTKLVGFNDQSDVVMSYNLNMVQNSRIINVLVDAPSAEFYADGLLVAKGKNSAAIPLKKGKQTELIVRAEGFLEYSQYISFSESASSLNLTQRLSEDKAYTASQPGADVANKRMEFMVKKKMSRENAIQRMKYYISELFETLEINDNVSGWYRTAWNVEEYPDKFIRSRVEIKEIPDNGDGQLKFKFLLQSQVAPKKNYLRDEDYKDWDRVLKKYAKLVMDVRNLVE